MMNRYAILKKLMMQGCKIQFASLHWRVNFPLRLVEYLQSSLLLESAFSDM